MRYLLLGFYFIAGSVSANKLFVGYDLGEMAFNDFRHFSGEAGLSFEDSWRLTIAHMNVAATEAHLSSNFATAVDGDGVEGDIYGYELFLTKPFYSGWYLGGSVGYYSNEYRNIHTKQSLSNSSPTIGIKAGYRQESAFGVPFLYWDLGVPFRYTIDHYDDTELGDATVKSNQFENNIWFNIGLLLQI
ncbi:hypothetical protein [Agaribacterium sp. ZY112]|uniref:hypothetical protein n=1 Tax=Agaribacterium sp. ZY112 TaxID=3233574 RepID=UPI0035258ED9